MNRNLSRLIRVLRPIFALLLAGPVLLYAETGKVAPIKNFDLEVTPARLDPNAVYLSSKVVNLRQLQVEYTDLDFNKIAAAKESKDFILFKFATRITKSLPDVADPKHYSRANLANLLRGVLFRESKACENCYYVTYPLPKRIWGQSFFQKLLGIPEALTCHLQIFHTDNPSDVSPKIALTNDRRVGPIGAQTLQTCSNFNAVVEGTSSVSNYFEQSERQTLVIGYQIFAIKRENADSMVAGLSTIHEELSLQVAGQAKSLVDGLTSSGRASQ